ncbi:hypothetical protein CCUS01_04546 [Colletotrichum cuscutae]|uniref:Uncharacterized protein n=1 Tax=Colletotrichum cuscutae TaxID=1209917 RepID=A0AAI9VFH6_9PEZI|nr:hypothetical protein CCUS01_04546 [Colletotrichum cuscutae]
MVVHPSAPLPSLHRTDPADRVTSNGDHGFFLRLPSKNNRQWDGYTIVLQALVTVYRIRAAPCRPFRFPSSTVPAHTGTRKRPWRLGWTAEREKHDTKTACLGTTHLSILNLVEKKLRLNPYFQHEDGSPKPNQETLESSLWSISSSDLLLYFTRRSLGSGGLSVWAYAPITSDIMPFEAGDPEAPSNVQRREGEQFDPKSNIDTTSESPRGPFHVWEMNRDTSSSKTHTRKRRYGQISAFSQTRRAYSSYYSYPSVPTPYFRHFTRNTT